MPLIQISVPVGSLSLEQKRRMVEKVTDAVIEVEGPAVRRGTWVHITEVADGGWGMAGKAYTLDELRAAVSAASRGS